MIEAWRTGWSAVAGTTDPEFPFGIQTLQSTEGSCGNGAFRWAQVGTQAILHLLVVMCRSCLLTDCLLGQALNEAVLPSTKHPKIFLAQGFDAQDPTGDQNWPT